MAESNSHSPTMDGVDYTVKQLLADDSDSNTNSIPPLTKSVKVEGVVNDANDYIVLPSLNSCPDGHEITILCSASSNFEIRTPASSAEEINSEDCDGTKEMLATDGNILSIIKINDTVGWMSSRRTALGAWTAPVVPN